MRCLLENDSKVKSLVAATTQLFPVSQKLINCCFLLLEMPTKSSTLIVISESLYNVTSVNPLVCFLNKQASSTQFSLFF